MKLFGFSHYKNLKLISNNTLWSLSKIKKTISVINLTTHFKLYNNNLEIDRRYECKYQSLSHERIINENALKINRELKAKKFDDGLNTLKYEINSIEKITDIATKYKVKI